MRYKINLLDIHREVLLESINIYKGMTEKNFEPLLNYLLKKHKFDKDFINEKYIGNLINKLFEQDTPNKENSEILELLKKIENQNNELIVDDTDIPFINQVLELNFRIAMGQFSIIADNFMNYWEYRDEVEEVLYDMRNFIMHDLANNGRGASYGIRNEMVDSHSKIACDMQQVFRHRYYWDKFPEGGMQVYFDTPYHIFSKVPLVTIQKV